MQIPEDVYNLIYQHLFRLTVLPDIKNARDDLAKQRLKFKDPKKIISFVGFQAEFVSDVRWSVSQEGHVRILALDITRTFLLDCSYACSASVPATTKCAEQDFCFHLPSAMSILSYDDKKRSASKQYTCISFTDSQVQLVAGAAKGHLPLLDMNNLLIGLPDTMPEYIAATVPSFELHKAVSHLYKHADHLILEYKDAQFTVSGALPSGGSISIQIACNSSSLTNCWRQEFQGKMLLRIAKAFNKYYARSQINLELREDFPLIFKVDDGDFCSKVMLAPWIPVATNDNNDSDDVDPEPI